LLPGEHHRLAGEVGNRVDEDDRLRGQELFEPAAGVNTPHMLVVALAVIGVRIGRRVGAADQHRQVAEIAEAAHRDAGARPVLHRLHAGFQVEADGLVRR
jgi:hypothetical protein